ncbi:GNAT family N-acetyltransferase [Serinicoccus kebangsaanensis]|uniref:GNAT family N-acetyltransferase n=1 Tax=Serinicoccus kebangsaanensis TaxID=2602069 RepID=UPI00192DBE6F|nr:GNAT family N-acetyltransferase [Serinicoccus kebangsaanensis]
MGRRDGPVSLEFRQARPDDAAAAQAAYRQIIDHLAATAVIPHWHTENRPTPSEVQGWVEAGELYLAVDQRGERIAGLVALNHDATSAYRHASWAVEASPGEVLVVHALGVCPDFLRQGVARFLVDASLDVAREKGCRVVRLDTYVENAAARLLYARCGFTDLGVHTLHYEGTELSQFHLFERVL